MAGLFFGDEAGFKLSVNDLFIYFFHISMQTRQNVGNLPGGGAVFPSCLLAHSR